MTQLVFLSHDVDWRRQGPPAEHMLARKDRFDPQALRLAQEKGENLYYNIPEIMELEEKFWIRSTFFFRTMYENGDYLDYEDDIKSLQKGGWEIGLHTDPSSVVDTERIRAEKALLEILTKTRIRANRVHYMKFDPGLPDRLEELGFVYDSSTKQFRDAVTAPEDMNYRFIGRLVEFPITLMDAYMFTYMKVPEEKVLQTFENMLAAGRSLLSSSSSSSANAEFNIVSVLWHDNVIRMKGGRMYPQVLEYLASQDDVKIMRGIDLAEMIIQRQQQRQKQKEHHRQQQ